jgi:hypothetical protein
VEASGARATRWTAATDAGDLIAPMICGAF